MTKPRTERYLTLSGIHDFVRSVHLDARPNHARNVIQPFRGIHDFVQQVARYDSHYQLIFLFLAQTFTSVGVAVKYPPSFFNDK